MTEDLGILCPSQNLLFCLGSCLGKILTEDDERLMDVICAKIVKNKLITL